MALPADASLYQYPGYANARTYDAEFDRLISMCYAGGEGICPVDQSKDCTVTGMGTNKATDLEVLTNSSGLQLSVTAGQAWVKGDYRTTQGLYFCRVPTAEVVTLEAAHATLPRLDYVILQVTDADIPGDGTTQWDVTYAKGTATAGASLTNLVGLPTLPSTALLLAVVLVPAAFAGPFVTATHVSDYRAFAYRPGRTLGILSSTANGAGSGDKAGPLTICGNATNAIEVVNEAIAMLTTGAGGTNVTLYLHDAASAGGNILGGIARHSPGTNYEMGPGFVSRIAAFSGRKTLYLDLQNASGTPTLEASASVARFLIAKYS